MVWDGGHILKALEFHSEEFGDGRNLKWEKQAEKVSEAPLIEFEGDETWVREMSLRQYYLFYKRPIPERGSKYIVFNVGF